MRKVQLASFRNTGYDPGRHRFWQAAWFLLGAPLVRCHLLPFSNVRIWILRFFGAKIGAGAVIKPGVRVKYPWLLAAGQDCWFGEDCWIDNLAPVTLGDSVCISQGAYLCTGNHDWSDPAFGLIVKPITLCDGAWVGAKTFVAPGVMLGECAVGTAGSVLAKPVPPYEIHGGNPAVFLRRREISDGSEGSASVPLAADSISSDRGRPS